MEHFGTGPATVHGTVHSPILRARRRRRVALRSAHRYGRDFHVYSVAWDPGKILWYVNKDLYHAVTPADLNRKHSVFSHDFSLLIDVAISGTAWRPARQVDDLPADDADRLHRIL